MFHATVTLKALLGKKRPIVSYRIINPYRIPELYNFQPFCNFCYLHHSHFFLTQRPWSKLLLLLKYGHYDECESFGLFEILFQLLMVQIDMCYIFLKTCLLQ
ncbi:unnamed protein product [Pipistrellus nathusii]|uniref:Uncharacterized protein n=1 Tax=Pipistrellus nathusii TaxID=59473 RepID=A0ABP0A7X4_PIPNA